MMDDHSADRLIRTIEALTRSIDRNTKAREAPQSTAVPPAGVVSAMRTEADLGTTEGTEAIRNVRKSLGQTDVRKPNYIFLRDFVAAWNIVAKERGFEQVGR